MRGFRRRFWTVLVSVVAGLVLAAAVVSGLFQVAVQALPGYRADLEQYVRDTVGRPVRIGSLALIWRYYYPSLDLLDVALEPEGGGEPTLRAERVRLGFALTRLVQGDATPDRLELHGLALELMVAEDAVTVVGLGEAAATGDGEPAMEALSRFSAFRLERCRLNVIDRRSPDGARWSFGIVEATLAQGLFGRDLEAEVTLPASFGDVARVTAEHAGELMRPSTWSGAFRAEIDGISGGPWLDAWMAPGATVEFRGASATLGGRMSGGEVEQWSARLQVGPLQGRREQHQAHTQWLDAGFVAQRAESGWTVEAEGFQVDGAAGAWQAGDLSLALRNDADGRQVEARAGRLRLDDLVPWLPIVGVAADWASAVHGAVGDLVDLELAWSERGATSFNVRTRFERLGLDATGRPAGFAGLEGEVAADESGGRAILPEQALVLALPGVLQVPRLELPSIEADVQWRRREAGWQLEVPAFRWAAFATQGHGRLQLDVPAKRGASPNIDLLAEFSSADVTRAKPLMPQDWGSGLNQWLEQAILGGHATDGRLAIRGALDDFPFDRAPGEFSLDVTARDIRLAFQPDWPPVDGIHADLEFRGNRLDIEATQGSIGGNAIRGVSARFADFDVPDLVIDGRVDGNVERFYDYLRRTPLRADLSGLLDHTTASGPAALDLQLLIPLEHADDTTVNGTVDLRGVELDHRALPQPLRNLRGPVRFGVTGIAAQHLTATFYDLAVEGSLSPLDADVSRVDAAVQWPIDPEGAGASELIPDWLRTSLSGSALWHAQLEIGGPDASPVRLSSSLAGVTVDLPPPMGKAADDEATTTLVLRETDTHPLKIDVDFDDRLKADLRFSGERALELDAGGVWIGGGEGVAAPDRGVFVSGTVGTFDVPAWREVFTRWGVRTDGPSLRADLNIQRVVWDEWSVREARYQWAVTADGWRSTIVGSGGAGEVTWREDINGGSRFLAKLDHLAADYAPDPDDDAQEPAASPFEWPELDLDLRRLTVGAADLGSVRFVSRREAQGQSIEVLRASGAMVDVDASGRWTRRDGQSSADLDFDFTSTDIATVLQAASYTPNLDAERARFRGQVRWAPTPEGLEWELAQGQVQVEIEDGQLRAVEPGAGRVLGLINIFALPRRLTLNFSDVLSSGLGFDEITGRFRLDDGQARTDDLEIDGPSLRMEVRGRIGLADRDYDQVVTVYPDVSAGVTLGAVLLGGPIAGVLTLIAQEILQKPLDQVTQLSYRVTGSWDDPRVDEKTGEVAKPLRDSGSPSKAP